MPLTNILSSMLQIPMAVTHQKSNGIYVKRAAARHIRAGNRYRAMGEWSGAAAAYSKALEHAPHLHHIWLQLGHARKEEGDLSSAMNAYEQATRLPNQNPEAFIHLGHAAKLAGLPLKSLDSYGRALKVDQSSLAAAAEIMRTADPRTQLGSEAIFLAAQLMLQRSTIEIAKQVGEKKVTYKIYVDISDLLNYFIHARLPTGIQRVQIELALGMLEGNEDMIGICGYSSSRCGWSLLSNEQFIALATNALISDNMKDNSWKEIVISAMLALVTADLISFPAGSILFNVGTSWSERNYFLSIREAKRASDIKYLPLMFDLLPVIHPEWFPASLVADYRQWITELSYHADAYLTISESTRDDLLRFSTRQRESERQCVNVLALDGDFRSGLAPAPLDHLKKWGLHPGSYVLMVSTLEPRKNHLGAFQCWGHLINYGNLSKPPMLVCVGGRGWMNDAAHAYLAANPKVRAAVKILHGIGDADLALLYSEAAFTFYPSFYEGWGLPVTESLCYGKIPVISQTSSLPEAGGKFAIYIDPKNSKEMAETIFSLWTEPRQISAREKLIQDEFRPRQWNAIGEEAIASLVKIQSFRDLQEPFAFKLAVNTRYSLYTPGAHVPSNYVSGERIRAGLGWYPTKKEGSQVRGNGALKFIVTDAPITAQCNIAIRLTAGIHQEVRFRIEASPQIHVEGTILAASSRWVTIPYRVTGEPIMLILTDISARESDAATLFVADIEVQVDSNDEAPA